MKDDRYHYAVWEEDARGEIFGCSGVFPMIACGGENSFIEPPTLLTEYGKLREP